MRADRKVMVHSGWMSRVMAEFDRGASRSRECPIRSRSIPRTRERAGRHREWLLHNRLTGTIDDKYLNWPLVPFEV